MCRAVIGAHADLQHVARTGCERLGRFVVKLQQLPRQEQRNPRAKGEAVVSPQRKHLQLRQQLRIIKAFPLRLAGEKDPSTAHKALANMIDQQGRGGKPMRTLHTQASVDR